MFSQAYDPPKYEDLDKYKVVDSAYLKCAYQLTWIKNKKLNEKENDFQVLLIGKSTSKYYSQLTFDHRQSIKKYIGKGQYPANRNWGAWSFVLFKNYPTSGNITVADIGSPLLGNFLYKEETPVLNWTITEEKQKILSYNCMKATTSFRGRNYVAWFTSEIPIPNGPWKFGGLPGLILKLSDEEGHFVFECSGIENLKKKESIRFYQIEYTKTTYKDLARLYRRYHNDFTGYRNALGIMVVTVDPVTNKRQENPQGIKLPYNPIELE